MSLSDLYLNALRIDRRLPVLEQIRAAVREHQRQYTFNNVEVLLQPEHLLNLEPEHLLQKIVRENRGGYCFEHNRLLYAALQDLGLNVSARLARVLYGQQDGDFPRTHRISVLNYNGTEYLIDVGFGPYTPARDCGSAGELTSGDCRSDGNCEGPGARNGRSNGACCPRSGGRHS